MAQELLFLCVPRAVELLRQRIEGVAALGILLFRLGESFSKGGAEVKQPSGVFFYQIVPIFAAEPPDGTILDGDDRGRTGLAREQGHFSEAVLRPQHPDALRSPARSD